MVLQPCVGQSRSEGHSSNTSPLHLHPDSTSIIRRMEPTRRRESVCRSLFGPVDRDQLQRDLELRLREISEEDSRRWNFNFQCDAPLLGRFQWEEVPAGCAAASYQECAPREEDAACASTSGEDARLIHREEGTGTDQENCSSISNTPKCPAEGTPVRRKRKLSKSAAKPRNSARITDFFAKRRRTTETKSLLKPSHMSEAALCRTIR